MYALASTLCSILRGTTTNAWGDIIDDPDAQVIASGVPVALDVTNTTAYDPSTQQIRTIRSISGAIQSDTDITANDRIRDDISGAVYVVESVTYDISPSSVVGDLELVLKQVS